MLGLTPSSYTPGTVTPIHAETSSLNPWVELLTFAYLAQCRCDPTSTMDYFTALVRIVQTMQAMDEDTPMVLQNLVLEERARNRFTRDDLLKAVITLGFGPDGPLGVPFDESVEKGFITNAWRDGIRRSWEDETNGSATRRKLSDALRVIAHARGSAEMHRIWKREKGGIMISRGLLTIRSPKGRRTNQPGRYTARGAAGHRGSHAEPTFEGFPRDRPRS
jgi:ubiquitin carboxyl-terminal hydrolase 25/28